MKPVVQCVAASIREEASGALSVLEIRSSVRLPSIPFTTPMLLVYRMALAAEDVSREVHWRVAIKAPDGSVSETQPVHSKQLPDRDVAEPSACTFLERLTMTFEAFGSYEFDLEIDDEAVATALLEVLRKPAVADDD